MKKQLAFALAAALCGCCNVRITSENGHDVVDIDNTSWRFLGLFSVISGDPEYPNRDVCLWFCDSLLLDVNMMLLDDAMRQHGYRAFKNISSFQTHEDTFVIFSRHTLHTSAELVR